MWICSCSASKLGEVAVIDAGVPAARQIDDPFAIGVGAVAAGWRDPDCRKPVRLARCAA